MINIKQGKHDHFRNLLLLVLFTLSFSLATRAATRTSVASGDWHTNSTWSSNDDPDNNDDVIIASGHIVTLSADETSGIGSLTIQLGGTLDLNGFSFTNVSGEPITIDGTLLISNAAGLTNAFASANITTGASSVINFSGGGTQVIGLEGGFDLTNTHIQITNSTVLQFSGTETIKDLTIGAGSTADLATNASTLTVSGTYTNNGTLNEAPGTLAVSDTTKPTLSSLTPSTTTIVEGTVGTGTFTITLVFDEAMDGGVAPVIDFPVEDPSAIITLASGSWSNTTTFVATYDVTDSNTDVANIDVRVSVAQDVAGNVITAVTQVDKFSATLASVSPTVISLNVSDNYLTKADVGAGNFVVTVVFSESMSVAPTLDFPVAVENPTSTIGSLSVSALPSSTITYTYTVSNASEFIADVDVRVSGGENGSGTAVSTYISADVFSINTSNSRVISVTPNFPTLTNANEGISTFTLKATFDLPMQNDGSANPTFSFPVEDPSAFIAINSVVWPDAFNCVATFDVANVNAALSNVDVRVNGAEEVDGTPQIATIIADVFSISTSITAIIYVNSNGSEDYTTISAAIAGASDGNQIIVRAGTYKENISFGNKDIFILGDAATPTNVIISGTGTGPVVTFSNSAKAQRIGGVVIENGVGFSSNFANVTSHGQTGKYGGGVVISKASKVTLDNVIVRNNSVAYDESVHNGGSGGGIYIADNSVVTISKCTITGNTSEVYRGGGMCVDKSRVTAMDVTIISNAGGHYGGGLAAYNSTLTFTNVKVSGNSLTSGDAQGADVYLHQTTVSDMGGGSYGTRLLYQSSGI